MGESERRDDAGDDHEADEPEIVVPPEYVAGVWANWGRVTYTEHEWTLDFIRMDPYENKGTVVARVSCSFSAFGDLVAHLNAMQQAWIDDVSSKEGGNGQTPFGGGGPGSDEPA